MPDLLDLAGLAAKLNSVEGELAELPQRVVEAGASIMLGQIKKAIGTYEYDWPELKAVTQSDRVRKGYDADRPLLRSGSFCDSVTMEIGHHEAVVGSDDPRAGFFEVGTAKMPPRPVFGPTILATEDAMLKMIRRETKRALRGSHGANEFAEALEQLKRVYEEGKDAVEEHLFEEGER